MIEPTDIPTAYRHVAVVLKSLTTTAANHFLAQIDPEIRQKIVREMQQTRLTAESLHAAIAKLKLDSIGTRSFASQTIADTKTNTEKVNDTVDVGSYYRIDDVATDVNNGSPSGLKVRPNLDFSKSQSRTCDQAPFHSLAFQHPELLRRMFDDLPLRSAAVILSTSSFEFALQRLKAIHGPRKVEIMHAIANLDNLSPAEVIDVKFSVRLQIQRMLKNEPALTDVTVATETLTLDNQNTAPPKKGSQPSGRSNLLEQGKLIARLLELPDAQLKQLLKTIDTACLAPALRMCPIEIQRKVLKNMAPKPAEFLAKEIVSSRVDETHRINKARSSIARAIERLTK